MANLTAIGLLAALVLGQSEPEFQARHGQFTMAFSDIERNSDSSWRAATVVFEGPGGYIKYMDATFEGTDNGTIEVEGDPCSISIETVADANGNDAGWSVTYVPSDDEEEGCDMLPKRMQGTYTSF